MLLNAVYLRGDRRLSRRGGVGLLAFVALIVTGCPTEVPFQAPEDGEATETSEAPAFNPEASADGSTETAATPDPEPEPDGADPPADRYATPPNSPPDRMPWESADGGADEGEVPDLFAQTDAAPATGRYAETAEEPESEQEEDSYADFLGDAYAGLLDDDAEEEKPDEPTEAEMPPAVAKSDDPSGLPFELPPDVAFEAADLTPENDATAIPKLPTTTEPVDASALEDLWADVDDTAPPTNPKPAAEEPEPPSVEPVAEESSGLPFEEPSLEELFGDVDDTPTEEVAPAPEPAFEPEAEPEPEPIAPAPEPAVTRPAARPKPTRSQASPGVKPLPSVPVLPFNTRHLAWLLGGKLALAELADLEGATPSEIADWDAEVERLARELKIRNPSVSPRPDNPAERVKAMMDAASRAGGELSRAYGPDHSALLEIAVKSNTLLIVAADRPDLALPVADAVRAAADDAMLPRFLWGESIKTLTNGPSSEEATDAVERLHRRVESFLR